MRTTAERHHRLEDVLVRPAAAQVPRQVVPGLCRGGRRDLGEQRHGRQHEARGAVGTLEASRFCPGRKNYEVLEINGSRGSLRFNLERLNELEVYWKDAAPRETRGFTDVLVTETYHPFWSNWWPQGHIIGWEHTFVHELAHLLEAIARGTSVAPYGATFEDGYRAAVVCDAIAVSARARTAVQITY